MSRIAAAALLAAALAGGPAAAFENPFPPTAKDEAVLDRCLAKAAADGAPPSRCKGRVLAPCLAVAGVASDLLSAACVETELSLWDGRRKALVARLEETLDAAGGKRLLAEEAAWNRETARVCHRDGAGEFGDHALVLASFECWLDRTTARMDALAERKPR